MAPVTRPAVGLRLLLLVVAVVCLLVALLLASHVFSGGNEEAWKVGGLLAFVLSVLVP